MRTVEAAARGAEPFEIVLPRRVVRQPTPLIYQGGDCGACVLAGLTGLSVPDVYKRLTDRDKPESFSPPAMRNALQYARRDGLLTRTVVEIPIWPFSPHHVFWLDFGLRGDQQCAPWWSYLVMAIEAGYYAIAAVRMDKDGVSGAHHGATDHWVMLVGVRGYWKPFEDGSAGARYEQEVLVSCSARSTPDEEWVRYDAFLRERGGFALLLGKP